VSKFKNDRGERELIPIGKFAKLCNVSERSIRRYIRDGIIPGYKVGHVLLKCDKRDVDLVVRRVRPEEISA